VLAIHRRGHILHEKLSDIRLAVGDVLMVLIDEQAMAKLRTDDMLIVLSENEEMHHIPYKAMMAVAIILTVVVVSALHLLPIPIANMRRCCNGSPGCFGHKDVYEGMDWKIIVLLARYCPWVRRLKNRAVPGRGGELT
jgi:di/tricarboxylate transporter